MRDPHGWSHVARCATCEPHQGRSGLKARVQRHGSSVQEKTIREELEGNLCRCTGYHNIVKAIQAAAANM